MKFAFAAAALSLVGLASALTMNTPASLTECVPVALSWSNGTSPYYLTVIQGGSLSTILQNFGEVSSTSYTWTVSLASGTNVGFVVTDSTGTYAASAALTIQAGTSTSCLTAASGTTAVTSAATSVAAASSVAASSSTRASSATSAAASVSTSTRVSSSSSSSSAATAAASSSTTTSTSGSLKNAASLVLGAAGLITAMFA